jgi:sarcosine oxidase subunit alpha
MRVCADIDLGKDAFPHMAFRTGHVGDIPARIHRVSFTGEVGFEINVAADQTGNLWRELLAEGKTEGLCPYGIDALNALRTEKGYLHIGADTDTTTTPLDLGWESIIARKSGDFVGRRALSLPEYRRADRLQLVGIVSTDPAAPLLSGEHLIRPESRRSEGYLTSTHFSRTLGHAVALARLENGRARLGEELLAYDQGTTKRVRVVKPVFYDVEGLRLQA